MPIYSAIYSSARPEHVSHACMMHAHACTAPAAAGAASAGARAAPSAAACRDSHGAAAGTTLVPRGTCPRDQRNAPAKAAGKKKKGPSRRVEYKEYTANAVFLAVQQGLVEIVHILLLYGADSNIGRIHKQGDIILETKSTLTIVSETKGQRGAELLALLTSPPSFGEIGDYISTTHNMPRELAWTILTFLSPDWMERARSNLE